MSLYDTALAMENDRGTMGVPIKSPVHCVPIFLPFAKMNGKRSLTNGRTLE